MRARWTIPLAALLVAVPVQAEPLVELDATDAKAAGSLEGVGVFAGLLHQRDANLDEDLGSSLMMFGLQARQLTIERDTTPFVGSTSGVGVPAPGAGRTETTVHENATLASLASEQGYLLAIFPVAGVTAEVLSPSMTLAPASGSLKAAAHASEERVEPTVNVDGSTTVDARGGNATLEGDLFIVLWAWDALVEDAEGEHEYPSGHMSSPTAAQAHVEAGQLVQLFILAEGAVLHLDLPADRPSGLHLDGARVDGAERIDLDGALGHLGGHKLRGDDVTFTGEALSLELGDAHAGHLPVSIGGDYAEAMVDGQPMLLGALPHYASTTMIPWIAGAAVVAGIAVSGTAASRLGTRGPYHSRWLNLSDRAFDRGWGHFTLWLATAHLRRHDACPDGWKLRTDALHRLGRQAAEAAARERAAPLLEPPHALHNGLRLVILHGALGNTDEALAWLEVCRRMDAGSVQRLAMAPVAADLGRDVRFRAGVGRVLGLEHHVSV